MKKFLSVVLVAAMMTAALASCAGDDASTTTTGGKNDAATTTVNNVQTTPTVTPPITVTEEENPEDVPEVPMVPGDGLEELLEGKTSLTAQIDMVTLSSVGFSAWNDQESIAGLFDGIDTELEWFYDPDENGDLTVLKSGADPENADGTQRGGGPGKMGGGIANPTYFYFGLLDQATITAYVLTTGNDNVNYPGRNPDEWWLYGTNDQSVFEACSIDGAEFDETQWTKLDYVYSGSVTEDNFAKCGYEIDADKQGAYQYYVWKLGYNTGSVQLCEMEFYAG